MKGLLKIINILPGSLRRVALRIKLMLGLFIVKDSYLVSTGYIDAFINKSFKDKHGSNIPWMNYSMIALLNDKLTKSISVFEYGSGSSTKYFSKRVGEIVSVEYDKSWFETVNKELNNIDNATIYYQELNDNYPHAISNLVEDKYYDMVVIDGRMRNKCAHVAINFLKEGGVILFDDSQRPKYEQGIKFLKSKGYNSIHIEGLAPGGISNERTTLFYKPANNCLNI